RPPRDRAPAGAAGPRVRGVGGPRDESDTRGALPRWADRDRAAPPGRPERRPHRRDPRARARRRFADRTVVFPDPEVCLIFRHVTRDGELLGARRNDRAGSGGDLARYSDEALLALVTRGEDGALGELYDRYGRVAFGLALRIL